jgi:ArsR family transcriptional regulator
MSLDDLDAGARRLWPLIREQVAATSAADQDERRMSGVLARRRTKSAEFFSSVSGEWDRLRSDLFGDAFHLHALLGLLDPEAIAGDLGCGTGQLTALLAPHVKRVIAVDGSAEMLQAARERLALLGNVDLRSGSLEALPIDDAQLDVAICGLVLHHLAEPVRALGECARVLKPGGRALVIDMLPHDRAEYQQQMGHVWLGFSEPHMHKLLASVGLTAVRFRALPIHQDAKGPALFAATARKPGD